MTHERYLRLIENPELLSTISYEELKTLVLAYPYAHNLRYLLTLKAKQIDHPEMQRTLAAAAAYSLDRARLFKMFMPHAVIPVPITLEEEILELRPIAELRQEMPERIKAPAPKTQDNVQKSEEVTLPPNPPVNSPPRTSSDRVQWLEELKPDDDDDDDFPVAPKPPVQEPEPQLPPEPVKEPEPFSLPVEEPAAYPEEESVMAVKEALERPTFEKWMDSFNLQVLPEPKQPQKEEIVPPVKAQSLAVKSVTENQEIISETLARMLVSQGHISKAISMYERLILANPQKSAYFAAEIEKLKK